MTVMTGTRSVVAIAGALLCACVPPKKPEPTALEVQSFQTKEFEAARDTTFASVMSVFQDLGYIIQSADKETGFITANSPATSKTDWIFTGNTINSQTKATAFVDSIRQGFTSVRLNFVVNNTTSSWYGQAGQADKPILDPKPYQIAFDKIDDAIFVRSAAKPAAVQPATTNADQTAQQPK